MLPVTHLTAPGSLNASSKFLQSYVRPAEGLTLEKNGFPELIQIAEQLIIIHLV